MDPHVVFNCQKVLPNRFALALAAAARGRALCRRAKPRLDIADAGVCDLALREIAEGAFTRSELASLLGEQDGRLAFRPADPNTSLDGGSEPAAAAPAFRLREAVH